MAGNTSTIAPDQRTASSQAAPPERRTANGHAPPSRQRDKRAALSVWQVVHLLHRLGILAAAVGYFAICMTACSHTLDLLHDKDQPSVVRAPDEQYLMGSYLGTTTIRESPLVMLALLGDTSPRNSTPYLEAKGPSLSICKGIVIFQHDIYIDTSLRSMYHAIVQGTQYNLTFLAEEETELIMPVADCVSPAIILRYLPAGKFNSLVRKKHDPNDVAMVTVQLSNQKYRAVDQSERGPVAVATLTSINGLQASDVQHRFIISIEYPYAEFDFRAYQFLEVTNEGMWRLEIIPDDGDIPKVMVTLFRSGFYMRSETEQHNINNQVSVLSRKPLEAITQWGWVHGVQLLLAVDLLLSLVVLVLVIYRNLRAGELWVSDAFVAIPNTLLLRGALALLSWYLDDFWAVFEFCVRDANLVLGLDLTIYENIMRADLLGIYLSLCGLLGVIFREHVGPFVAMISFGIGYELRGKLTHAFPKAATAVYNFAYQTFVDGVPPYLEGQETISPMGYWTSHELHSRPSTIVFQTLLPILITLMLILAYIIACKIHRFFFPDKIHIVRNTMETGTRASSGEDTVLTQKRVLTLFKIATGTELESRFGIMASYEEYLIIKSLKFASAGGIYSSGFVVANNKYVLQTDDYWSIVLIEVTDRQFKSIFVYEIAGSTVQQTMKLVYPHTFAFTDLTNLNISVLS